MSKVEIPAGSVFPQTQQYWMPGRKSTLSCQAPAGSTVKVTLNGKAYAMKSSGLYPSSGGPYLATYSYTYTMPSYSGTPRNIDLGSPTYAITYKECETRTAPGKSE